MPRSPQEVFAAHVAALLAADVPKVLQDYAQDAVLLTADGPLSSHEEIGGFFTSALTALPDLELVPLVTVFTDTALLLEWSATSALHRVTRAVDTFLFAEGLIVLQTTVLHLERVAKG